MLIILFVLGLVIGSFLNVVIYRVPRDESIIKPPSHCPECDHRLSPIELIPVISYIVLKGKCKEFAKLIPQIKNVADVYLLNNYWRNRLLKKQDIISYNRSRIFIKQFDKL